MVMEQTSAEEARCWQERRAAAASAPECTRPALLDISWFTESMAAGQPVPVERRHRLEVSWWPGIGPAENAGAAWLGGAGDLAAAQPCRQMRGAMGLSADPQGPWEVRPSRLLLSSLL